MDWPPEVWSEDFEYYQTLCMRSESDVEHSKSQPSCDTRDTRCISKYPPWMLFCKMDNPQKGHQTPGGNSCVTLVEVKVRSELSAT